MENAVGGRLHEASWTISSGQANDAAMIKSLGYVSLDRGPPRVPARLELYIAAAEVEGSHRQPLADLPGRAGNLRQDHSRPHHHRGPAGDEPRPRLEREHRDPELRRRDAEVHAQP